MVVTHGIGVKTAPIGLPRILMKGILSQLLASFVISAKERKRQEIVRNNIAKKEGM